MDMPRNRTQLELLAPAGSYETFRAVIGAGADAVYLGGSRFGARAYADNFTEEEVLRAIDEAHIHGKKVYLTVNTLLKEQELAELYDYLLPYYEQGLDAVIVQDLGALALIRREFPGLAIHASTQMTVVGRDGAAYLKGLGVSRIVTAREMSLAEIAELHGQVKDIEIETFVHGALCYCYSGQCLLSSMLGGRSGNRGRCAQPCRLPYEVYDRKHGKARTPGNFMLSMKDLCGISDIPGLAESGVCSLKIEGRMKQAEYAAGVAAVYRGYVDRYLSLLKEAEENGKDAVSARAYAREKYRVSQEDDKHLLDLGNRNGFTDSYYFRTNEAGMLTYEKPNHKRAGGEASKWDPEERKEKINGILRLKKDLPAMIEVSCDGYTVETGGDMVQPAKKQPLSREKVEECMRKTGNTPFVFETLLVEMDDAVFLPVQALNGLRREALAALSHTLLKKYRRAVPQHMQMAPVPQHMQMAPVPQHMQMAPVPQHMQMAPVSVLKCGKSKGCRMIVSVEERYQLDEALTGDFVTDLYLDSGCYTREELFAQLKEDTAHIHAVGKQAYYVLPTVFRGHTAAFYREHRGELPRTGVDGVVVSSYDAAAFVRTELGRDFPMILDHSIYTWNRAAKQQAWELSPLRDTVPLELNRRELFARDNRGSEIVIYGHLPLMTSAQCVHANSGTCDRQRTLTYLKDRYHKDFPVRNQCAECYNTIYNTAPLMLFGCREELQKMGITAFRLAFTVEEQADVKHILGLCEKTFVLGDGEKAKNGFPAEYTNGHYRRGVE